MVTKNPQENKLNKQSLFNFYTADWYLFIAGILFTIAINIFTTVLLTKEGLNISTHSAIILALSFFISSFSAFVISYLLKKAQTEWQSEGSPKDLMEIYVGGESRITLMWFLFMIMFVGPLGLILLVLVKL